jgi:Fe-S cluster biogenesis protein NfuA
MKKTVLWLALYAGMSTAALAQHSEKELKEDIQRHRAMAAAHEGAAKCLETKKDEKVCMAELQAACKGLAIGKYCGMKHAH